MSKSIGSLTFERRVDALFSRYTAAGSPLGSPGAVVGVLQGGAIELCKGYGLASIELGVPIRPDTRFRIASVSKQFTVTAALMLAAEGKLKLSDPPHKYLPELAPLPVTIDQMMRNCSGLPDFLELLRLGGHGLDKPARPADLLAACLRNRHLNFTPGSRFLYSNTNFLLLGLIVEKLAGKKLGDFLAERVFTPLGMTGTMLAPEIDTVIPGLASGYLGDASSGFRRAAHAYPQGGEGGLTSTVEDLLIWSRHFDRPTLEPRTLPAQLAAVAPLLGGHANKYRRGVQADDLRGLATIGHGGLWPGFRTEFLRVPDADLTVVVIANLGSIDPWRQARAIAALALEGAALEGTKKLKPLAAAITEAEIKPIAGTWFNGDEPSLFDLAWRNGEAVVTQNGLPFALGRHRRHLCITRFGRHLACAARRRGLHHRRQRAPGRRRAGVVAERDRCRHSRGRESGGLDHRDPARPSRTRPHRQDRGAPRLDRPHQGNALRAHRLGHQRKGIAYISPPLVHSAFWPRSSLSAVAGPTWRS